MDVHNTSTSVAERVINVHTTKKYQWVLDNVFSELVCGQRNRILFWKSADREEGRAHSIHFFIEFAHKESVAIAQRQAIPGVTVHCLSRNQNMIRIFDCLSKGIELPKKRTTAETESPMVETQDSNRSFNSSTGPPSAKRQRIYENDMSSRPSQSPSFRDDYHNPYRQSTPLPYHSREILQRNNISLSKKSNWASNSEYRRFPDRNSNANPRKTRFRNNGSPTSDRSSRSPPRPTQRYLDDRQLDEAFTPHTEGNKFAGPHYRRQSDASSVSFDRVAPPARFSTPLRQPNPDSHRLPDLDSMGDSDVAAIVESLITTMSGPEAWITIAAHYRRKMLHRSALTVVQAMLEVMEKRGMEKSDLRPALLLMAQCHYSIAKQEGKESGADHAEESNRYFVTLLDWLRNAYGTNTPAVDAITQPGASTVDSSGFGTTWISEKENKPFLSHEDPSKRTSYLMRDPLRPVPGIFSFQSPSFSTARLDSVTDELNALRTAHSLTMADLAAARVSKYETEQALKDEVTKRCKAEHEIRDVRDGERVAQARALRETDSRKRTEERLAQERLAWERRMDEVKDETARNIVQDLTAILSFSSRAPASMLEATRGFCEARARAERTAADMMI